MEKPHIFHVEFSDNCLHPSKDNIDGKHFYFGSIAAIFDIFTTDDIGVSNKYLYYVNIVPGNPYVNKYVTIRKGPFYRKKSNRGIRPKK